MGLSERKQKQKIGLDPRNLSWSDDKSRFSYKHMTALGWTDNSGLGSGLSGNPNHIAVVRKSDAGGIGMDRARKDGSDLAAGAGQAGRGLEDFLKRIASAASSANVSPTPSPGPASEDEEGKKEENKVMRNRIASRQKHLNMKRMASQSPAALAEILGVPLSSLPASPSPSSTPQPEASSSSSTPDEKVTTNENERTSDETVTKSTLSVSDYFRQKMKEKMAARQAAASSSTSGEPSKVNIDDLPSSSLEKLSEIPFGSSSKPVGGTAWEGQKMQFEDKQVDFDPSSEPVSQAQPSEEEQPKKKKSKKNKKVDSSEESTPIPKEGEDPIHDAAENVHDFEHAGEPAEDEKMKKKREKEEKKRLKEEKKARKSVENVEGKSKDKKRKREEVVDGEEKSESKKEKKEKKEKKDKKEKKSKTSSS